MNNVETYVFQYQASSFLIATALFAARTLNGFDFGLTPLFRDRRGYMPPQLKTTALTYSGVENLDLCKRNVRLFWPLYNWGGFAMECYA